MKRDKLLKDTSKSREVIRMLSKSRKFKPKFERALPSLTKVPPVLRDMPADRSLLDQIRQSRKFEHTMAERKKEAQKKKYYDSTLRHTIIEK